MSKSRKIKANILPVGIDGERVQLYFFVEEEKYGKTQSRFHLGGLILFLQEAREIVAKLEELDFVEILNKKFIGGENE